MEEKVSFEDFIYGDGEEVSIEDIGFCVDRIIELPKIRPHKLEKAVSLAIKYSQLDDFRQKLLEKPYKCPSLIYQLHKKGVFVFEEIEPFLRNKQSRIICYYFRKYIIDFENFVQNMYISCGDNRSFFENSNEIDQLIEYGFLPSSIEYCLKYDVVDDLFGFINLKLEAKWSPFEWSLKPKYLDLLSFAGFFGSIKCFKYLLLNGFEFNDRVISMVVCSGDFDILHLYQGQCLFSNECLCRSAGFCHLSLLDFIIQNGANINEKDEITYSPLHYAAEKGHLGIVKSLVKHKAEINSKTQLEMTPLHLAAENGHLCVVEYLVNNKADIKASTLHGGTLLHLAAHNGHLPVVEYLLKNNLEIQSRCNNVEIQCLEKLLFMKLLEEADWEW